MSMGGLLGIEPFFEPRALSSLPPPACPDAGIRACHPSEPWLPVVAAAVFPSPPDPFHSPQRFPALTTSPSAATLHLADHCGVGPGEPQQGKASLPTAQPPVRARAKAQGGRRRRYGTHQGTSGGWIVHPPSLRSVG